MTVRIYGDTGHAACELTKEVRRPKRSAFLSLFLVAALMLAACAAGGVRIYQVTDGAFVQVSGFGME